METFITSFKTSIFFHQLLIKASNGVDSDKHYSIQKFIIKVDDFNDNYPVFTNPSVNGTTHYRWMVKNKTVLEINVSLFE